MDHVLVEAFLGKRQAALLSPGKETIQRAKCLEASATAYSEIGRTTLPIHVPSPNLLPYRLHLFG
jgi:hypothetical protein